MKRKITLKAIAFLIKQYIKGELIEDYDHIYSYLDDHDLSQSEAVDRLEEFDDKEDMIAYINENDFNLSDFEILLESKDFVDTFASTVESINNQFHSDTEAANWIDAYQDASELLESLDSYGIDSLDDLEYVFKTCSKFEEIAEIVESNSTSSHLTFSK